MLNRTEPGGERQAKYTFNGAPMFRRLRSLRRREAVGPSIEIRSPECDNRTRNRREVDLMVVPDELNSTMVRQAPSLYCASPSSHWLRSAPGTTSLPLTTLAKRGFDSRADAGSTRGAARRWIELTTVEKCCHVR